MDEEKVELVKSYNIAHDIARMNNILYVAEGDLGISSWIFSPDSGFKNITRWSQPERCIRQIVHIPTHNLLGVQLEAGGGIGFLKTTDNGSVSFIKEISANGVLYHRHLCRTIHPSGFMAALPLSCGLIWIDLKTLEMAPATWKPSEEACPFEDGAVIEGDRIWVVRSRRCGYFDDPSRTAEAVKAEALRPVEGAQLRGMPFIANDTLILLNRITGMIERIDISNVDTPCLLDRTHISAHPEFIGFAAGKYWIACGHEGLYFILPS